MWSLCHIVFLEGLADLNRTRLSNNRSVMPLDVLGCTRATLNGSACFPCPIGPGNPLNPIRGRDWSLQLFSMNQEFPVSASHKLALITSLPFVHTARRYYRLDVLVRHLDWVKIVARLPFLRKDFQTWASRGSKSRNKVSVGEPAEGSLTVNILLVRYVTTNSWVGSVACYKTTQWSLASLPCSTHRSEWCRCSSNALCSLWPEFSGAVPSWLS
jgi:hypothetical protein